LQQWISLRKIYNLTIINFVNFLDKYFLIFIALSWKKSYKKDSKFAKVNKQQIILVTI